MQPASRKELLPTYLSPMFGKSDMQEFNQHLNQLPVQHVLPETSLSNGGYHIGVPRKSGEVESLGEEFHWLKRQKVETPTIAPWDESFKLPSLQLSPDSSVPANVVVEKKVSEEVSSYARMITSPLPVAETVSGCSDITKIDSPLDCTQPVQGVIGSISATLGLPIPVKVYSLKDLFTTPSVKIDFQRPPLSKKKVDIVEEMKCDEGTKLNKRDVSLIERFTEEEIKLHIMSLKEGSGQVGLKEMSDLKEELCNLCGKGVILFPAQPLYCSLCSRRIRDNAIYYVPEEKLDVQHQLCNPCHTRCRSKFMLSGVSITKANMLKTNNSDNQNIEEWVSCGSCGKWQHQICGLYNLDKDIDKKADYICPHCLLEERKSMNKMGFYDNTDVTAKDLPETILSHFMEQRLFKRLKEERNQTAKATGKSINDVSEADNLTVRVVYSADKSSVVNKQFANLLQKEHYPSEFPYRSKVILLFQKVEGVDICIFALFVQEFGSECSAPNQRSVYVLYLDSVKYFRPERVTFTGEALRTFVYHEILIGYFEYCKIRGFTAGYIWACPPPKGEDYIMYSHPKTQQTPNTKKLRQWYVSMLDKAAEQKVVTNFTNLYDRFFGSKEESTCSATAAQLPYFEGSFWSYNAELLIQEIEKEGNDELQKKMKSLSKRKLKGLVRDKSKECVAVDDAKNILLMQKLEKMISLNKEDFMVVELNYSCTRCSKAILSGLRWFCLKCKNIQLCETCADEEHQFGEDKHHMSGKEKHLLSKAQVNGVQSTTEDNDVIIENNVFETRQAFLGFSQKHNYNFDTLRRAKHSSMMILHHLDTSNKTCCSQNSSSFFKVNCAACNKDVSTTIYFSCLLCSNYRVCTGCHAKNLTLRVLHLFPLIPSAHGTPPRTVGVLQMLDALLHAHLCKPTAAHPSCSSPKCSEVKFLFKHSVECKIKKQGACKICSNMWKIIMIHAYHCQDPICTIPRCRDMKNHLTRNGVGLQRYGRSCTLLRCSNV